jgi:hypothetical protein
MTAAAADYQACSTKRERKTKAQIGAIKAAIYELVDSQRPMTVRQTFYQLVVRGIIDKTEAEYQGTVIRLLTDMRMNGELPFSWIVDESRRVRGTRTFNNVKDALDHTAKYYRRSALEQAEDYLEVWCEKEALAGIIWDVTSEYDVPLVVSKGMPSLTLLYGTACRASMAAEAEKYSWIYQFGDHDPSGVMIPKVMRSRLEEMCRGLECPPPQVVRIALTDSQIAEHKLPTRPTKRTGNLHAIGFEGDSTELDALPPDHLRQMVRDVIEQHISQRELTIVRAIEDSEREQIRVFSA